MTNQLTYLQCLDILNRVGERHHDFNLDAISQALDYFKRPDYSYPSAIVAGTNGKGSTCFALSHLLQRQGGQVGLFTSPHLLDIRERIRFNLEPISQSDFAQLFSRIWDAQTASFFPVLSYFETLTLLAALYFQHLKVDYAIFEVGLGGRLDATNAMKHQVGGMCSISYDHEKYLGTHIADIAREKVGIAHRGMTISSVPQDFPEAEEVIHAHCTAHHISLRHSGREYVVKSRSQEVFTIAWPDGQSEDIQSGLVGKQHHVNLALAVDLARQLWTGDHPRLEGEIDFSDFSVPGRMQTFQFQKRSFLVDIAHNIQSIEALHRYVREVNLPRRLLWVGMLKDKHWEKSLDILSGSFQDILISTPHTDRAWDPQDAKRYASEHFAHVTCEPDISKALKWIEKSDYQNVVCCGSFFMVGPVMAHISSL